MCSVHNFHCKMQQSLSTDVVSNKCAYIKKTGSLLAYQEEFPFRQWQEYFFCLFFFFYLGLSNYEWVNGEEIDIVTIFENWLMKVIISCPNSLHILFFFFFLKNGLPLTEGCEFCSVCWLLVSFFLFSNKFRISQRRKYKHMYESSRTQNINSSYQHF